MKSIDVIIINHANTKQWFDYSSVTFYRVSWRINFREGHTPKLLITLVSIDEINRRNQAIVWIIFTIYCYSCKWPRKFQFLRPISLYWTIHHNNKLTNKLIIGLWSSSSNLAADYNRNAKIWTRMLYYEQMRIWHDCHDDQDKTETKNSSIQVLRETYLMLGIRIYNRSFSIFEEKTAKFY